MATTQTMTKPSTQELAAQLRVDSIRSTTKAGSGHPTSALSSADLMAVLLAKHLRYDFSKPDNPANDHLIFSKGHAAPLLYAMYKAVGAIKDEEMMTLREYGSRLEGHPTPVIPWVDVATGSLGQGLPIGVGVGIAGRYLDRLPYRVWVLLGDSEMSEGSVWEAVAHASHYRLGNLIAIVDVNRLGQRGETALGWNTEAYARRVKAFGWETIEIDGHDHEQIDSAYAAAAHITDVPTMIIARTAKGKGAPAVENKENWHGKALPADVAAETIAMLGGERHYTVEVAKPEPVPTAEPPSGAPLSLPRYEDGKAVATRKAYGEALRAIGKARPDVVVLDAEVSNSTFSEDFAHAIPERFFEMYIAEQQMVAAAVGFGVREYKPFASTFAAFLTRAYDFIRMASISRANIKLVGSHAGVSIGEDGPSQMALEDLAMMRAIYGSTVLYPSDPNQTAKLVAQMVDRPGIVYMRTTRAATPTLYGHDEEFPVGGSRVLRQSASDRVTVVAAGITVHEALKAADKLQQEGTNVRVIDAYSVKPIDEATLQRAARETGGIVVVEDHWPEGGLGDAVLAAFAKTDAPLPRIRKLGVQSMPGSGKPAELIEAAGISADSIVQTVRGMM